MLAYAALIIAIGVFMLPIYIKRHSNFKKTEFTQRIIEQNKDVPKMVSKIIAHHMGVNHNPSVIKTVEEYEEARKTWDTDRKVIEATYFEETYFLFNFFNTLADGINRGVYDEDLIRINFERDIKLFYRYSAPYLRNLRFSVDSDDMFLQMEFLIKEWDEKKPKKKKVTFFA